MERELWTKAELRNILAAAYYQSCQTPAAGQREEDYQRGFRVALATLAYTFGLAALPSGNGQGQTAPRPR